MIRANLSPRRRHRQLRPMCFLTALAIFSLHTHLPAQTISTTAGGLLVDGQTALNTPLGLIGRMIQDSAGNLVFAEMGNGVIRRIDSASQVTNIIAGRGQTLADSIPVPALQARIPAPRFMALDRAGNILFTDESSRLRQLSPDGLVSTIAGTGTRGYSGDGRQAIFAQFSQPRGVAVDSAGNIFVADFLHGVVRKIDASTRIITTVAGRGELGYSGDGGPAVQARLNGPSGIAVDAANNLYIIDALNHRLRRVNPQGIISTVMGNGQAGIAPNNVQASPTLPLAAPWDVATDSSGNIFLTETWGLVRRISPTGQITTVAGGGSSGAEGVPGDQAFVSEPVFVYSDRAGNVFFSEVGRSRIRRVAAGTGLVTTVAGTDSVLDGNEATRAVLGGPTGIALDAAGNIYIADRPRHRVRKVDRFSGIVTTIAGTGQPGFSGDGGPATAARLNFPASVAVNISTGDIYIADVTNIRVRKIDGASGIISTIAGDGSVGSSGDGGPSTLARLFIPEGVALDRANNVYIADLGNSSIRRIDASTGIITRVAGNGILGNGGDGGAATAASLGWPVDVAFDASGNMAIADRYFNRVRLVERATGRIRALMGAGTFGYSGDGGAATQARMALPGGLSFDEAGNLLVTESANHVVRRLDAASGTISTIAGVSPPTGLLGDGELATLASINSPRDVVLDGEGNFFIADEGNSRIRRVSAAPVVPVLAVTPGNIFFRAVRGGAPSAGQQVHVLNTNFAALGWTAQVVGADSEWLTVSTTAGSAPSLLTLEANPGGRAPGNYGATILISSPGAVASPQTVSAILTVVDEPQTRIALSSQLLNFQAISGGINPGPQSLFITNAGSGVLQWEATAQTSAGGDWLAISPPNGTAPGTIFVSVNAQSLSPGVYRGQIRITDSRAGGTPALAVVNLTVGERASSILLSTVGQTFAVVEGESAAPPQRFSVLNAGQGSMNWQLQTNTTSGGSWLGASAASTTSDASDLANSPQVEVSANASGLRAGVYGGLVAVSANGAVNSPQLFSTVLNVHPPGSSPQPVLNPSGLLYVVLAGSTTPSAKNVAVFVSGPPLSFSASVSKEGAANWLSVSPASGRMQGEGSIAVQVDPSGLAPAAYRGTITLSFSNGSVLDVSVLTVVTTVAAGASRGSRAREECAAGAQFILPTSIGNNFSLPVGFPATLVTQVIDNCGNNVVGANVSAVFDNGDPSLRLNDLRSGVYSATWTPQSANSATRLRFISIHPLLGTSSIEFITGVQQGAAPQIYRGGAVNGASFEPRAPLAPGSIISAFGENLTPQVNVSTTLPLATTLGGLSMRLGALDVPLYFTSSGQVNAQIPFEIPPNTTFPLVTSFNGRFTTPELITVAPAQPGIFTRNQSGGGPGAVLNQDFSENSPARPAARGSVVQIFATGLGTTIPPAPSGRAAPSSPVAVVTHPVSATIGGLPAVVQFAGLAPGFVGLYQVNVTVPAGVPSGPEIPLALFQSGAASNTVTVSIE